MLFSYRNGSKQWAIGGYTGTMSTNARFSIWEDASDAVFTGSGGFGTERFTVLPGGNVGIGQSAPANKLDVNGTIHAKAVNVDLNGWQDQVFSKTYRLRPLGEVKEYINKNHHLPEVPAEAVMVKKGLNVAEMNELLMKKVEELTLYLIEKDKKDDLQSEQIKALQKQISLLKKQSSITIKKSK